MKICRLPVVAIALLTARYVAAEDDAVVEEDAVLKLSEAASLVDTFEGVGGLSETKWFKSSADKYATQEVALDAYSKGEQGLMLKAPAKHYGVARTLDEPLKIDGKDTKELVVQYEVNLQNGLSCGGAYVKLLRAKEDGDFSAFDDKTPFVIMFGPDKCGANDKVHFIFQHKNPLTGEYEEKHLDGAPASKSDRLTHLYSLVVRDDNSYEMLIDQESVSNGTLLTSFTPAVLPPKEIEDPEDKKPADWVDNAEMVDPTATKPDDWDEDAPARIPDESAVKPENWLDDEPAMIDDPAVEKPEDWDDEDDGEWVSPQVPNPKCEAVAGCGEWERPTIANPAFKGKWHAPMIPNPAYKGEWKPQLIANPDYFNDEHPARMDAIAAVAVEVWTMSEGIAFDNFWLGNDAAKAAEFAALTWAPKHTVEVEEQELQRAKEQAELEAQRASENSLVQKVKNLATSYVEFAKGNPVVGVGALFAVGLVLVLGTLFACCSKSAPKEKDDSGDEADEETKEPTESKNASSGDESEGKKVRQRKKKAPVVKDD